MTAGIEKGEEGNGGEWRRREEKGEKVGKKEGELES
jgi:hypothetical protein